MRKILGIAGSLRRGSYNAALLRAAAELVPEETQLEIASIRGIPLYDADVEAEGGAPRAVAELKDRVAAANGLLLVTPEYNRSVPGVFKNAIDWLSSPSKDLPRVFGGKPVGLIGASPGRGGTKRAQEAWVPVLEALGTRPWLEGRLQVGGARRAFAENGALIDEEIRTALRVYLEGFARFIRTVSAVPRAGRES